jgi:hypothetical protein
VTLLAAALAYARMGWSVVPLHTPVPGGCSCRRGPRCLTPGKHPRIDWKPFQSRRASPDEIRSWWSRWPGANVGVVTGTISGLAVVDADVRNDGFTSLSDLDDAGFRMADDGPVVVTGGEGLHHFFRLDAPMVKAAPWVGVEVQADGALVAAPPSLHASGRRYRWARPADSPLPPLPPWVRWAVERTTTPVSPAPLPLPDADRDDVLGRLHARGWYRGPHRRAGLHRVICPWGDLHSNTDHGAVVIEPGHSTAPGWGFRCLHQHCAERHVGDLLDVLQIPRRTAA